MRWGVHSRVRCMCLPPPLSTLPPLQWEADRVGLMSSLFPATFVFCSCLRVVCLRLPLPVWVSLSVVAVSVCACLPLCSGVAWSAPSPTGLARTPRTHSSRVGYSHLALAGDGAVGGCLRVRVSRYPRRFTCLCFMLVSCGARNCRLWAGARRRLSGTTPPPCRTLRRRRSTSRVRGPPPVACAALTVGLHRHCHCAVDPLPSVMLPLLLD
jgi:hypothetical protein